MCCAIFPNLKLKDVILFFFNLAWDLNEPNISKNNSCFIWNFSIKITLKKMSKIFWEILNVEDPLPPGPCSLLKWKSQACYHFHARNVLTTILVDFLLLFWKVGEEEGKSTLQYWISSLSYYSPSKQAKLMTYIKNGIYCSFVLDKSSSLNYIWFWTKKSFIILFCVPLARYFK